MTENILRIENLDYIYDDGTKALKDVNISIKKGDKIAILGANGSGKSTLFFCLNGVHKPTRGKIYLYDNEIKYTKKGLLELREKVGIVFQEPDNQLFSAGVYEEISFGPMNLNLSRDEVKNRVEDVIDELMITDFIEKPVHFLSGGQKKQVSIADILVMKPEVIILDEPFSTLDPKHTKIVDKLINKLSDCGITVIISTHNVNHALAFADKIILLKDGKVLKEGKPREIFSDISLLNKTNLEQPVIIKIYEAMLENEIIDKKSEMPRNVEELTLLIENKNIS